MTGVETVVLLYGNIPVRRAELIDAAIEKLIATGADSVRSVAPVTKQHPDWVHRLDGDRMVQFRPNSIYRRQDLQPLYYHDGAIVVVRRAALFEAVNTPDDKQSFLGRDRRAIVCDAEDAVDVDTAVDLAFAEAVLRRNAKTQDGATKAGAPSRNAQTRDEGTEGRRDIDDCRLSIVDCRLQIGGRRVGVGEPVFIIAEAGVNHNGDVETALRMVDEAVRAGADAVKFQMFRADELASVHAPAAAYQQHHGAGSSQREILAGLELSLDDFARIKGRCDGQGIVFLATPFGLRDVDRLLKLDVPAFKIASTDLTNHALLESAARSGLPLIVSSGAADPEEIEAAVRVITQAGAGARLVLLHCVSCYPTPLEAINLRTIGTLAGQFAVPVGLSDHTTSLEVGGWAVMAGACVLEKHFTLERNAKSPDHAMSLNPGELAAYISAARRAESARGDGALGVSAIEEDVRRSARKSIVAVHSIPAGTRITADMLTLKRPGTGIAPARLAELVGRRAATDILGDALLAWTMLR
jgi:N-acetylneuraminate synthase/N,N'-diacetyllegionaminate synthase